MGKLFLGLIMNPLIISKLDTKNSYGPHLLHKITQSTLVVFESESEKYKVKNK